MKKLFFSFLLVVTTMMTANAMSKYRSSREARFLTDKMAWELDLTPMQMEDVYEINYDYFRSLVDVNLVYTREYDIRNEELKFVLSPWQWERFIAREYFLTPVRVLSYAWYFPIHVYYHSDHFYFDAPHAYSHYRGGHAYNRDYYRIRIDIHHPDGHFRPAPAPKPKPEPRPNYRHNEPRPGGQAGGNMQPGRPNGGNANPGRPNNGGGNQHSATPSRTTPNRSGSVNRSQGSSSRSGSNSSSTARPTRSQNSSNRSATSGRR